MKVLTVNTTIGEGGAAHSAININQVIKELGINSWMLTARGERDISNSILSLEESKLRRYCNILAYRLLGKEGYFNQNLWNKALQDLDSFDLVHIHNAHGYYLPFNILEKIMSKPTIWTLHDYWIVTGGPGYFVDQKEKKLIEKVLSFSNLRYPKEWVCRSEKRKRKLSELINKFDPTFVAVSNDMAVRLKNNGLNSDNVNIIPHGLFESDVTPDPSLRMKAKKHLGWPSDKKILLFVSAQIDNPIKGFNVFLKALSKIKNNHQWVAYVIGSNYKNAAVNAKKRGLNIQFLGKIVGDDMENYYQACDIYVSSTFDETFGLTVVEALANGCQVICSNLPILREVTDNRAIFFEVGSSEMLANKVLHSMKNPISEIEIINNAQYIINKFSKKKMGRQYLNLYKQVLG